METRELDHSKIEINLNSADEFFSYVQYMKYVFQDLWGVEPDAMSCGPEEVMRISAVVGEHYQKFPYGSCEDQKQIYFDYPKEVMGLKVYLKQGKGIEFLFEDIRKAPTFMPIKKEHKL